MNWLRAHSAGLFLVVLAMVVLIPMPALGDSMGAIMEFDFAKSDTTSQDSAGTAHTGQSNNILQRYILRLRKDIYPTLSFGAEYVLEKYTSVASSDDKDFRSSLLRTRPSANLDYRNPYFTTNLGYNKLEATTQGSGIPSEKMIQDNVSASFALVRQERRPSLSILYNLSHAYDQYHLNLDSVSEQYTLTSRYKPVPQIDLRYTGNLSDSQDKLHGAETTDLLNSGRVEYNDSFLKNRVRFYSIYSVSNQQNEFRFGGSATGEVPEDRFPFAGLMGSGPLGTDSPPEVPALDTMVSNSLLIDGNKNATSGINIGYSALVTAPRNMGLDLGTAVELNSIFVWVNQRLPGTTANSFSWDIYVSSDITDLKQWTLLQTAVPATFGLFDARFELRFANVTTRFIKVVTRPLASPVPVPGVDVNNILITELEAFIFVPGQVASIHKTRNTSQRIELGTSVQLAKVPNLLYDLSYTQTKSSLSDFSPSLLLNRLSLNQRISKVFTTGAYISRQDSAEKAGMHITHDYSAFLTATPLNTLSHSLRFSRQTDELNDHNLSTNSVYFNNSAALYRGVNLSLAVGQTESRSNDGRDSKSTGISAGSTLIPYRTMTINLYYDDRKSTTTDNSGQGFGFESTNQSGTASVSYTPFQTLFLYASYQATETVNDNRVSVNTWIVRTQNYVLSWSPAFTGQLWLTVTGTQTLTSNDQGKADTLTIGPRWTPSQYMTFEAGYQLNAVENISSRTKTETIFATLRISL